MIIYLTRYFEGIFLYIKYLISGGNDLFWSDARNAEEQFYEILNEYGNLISRICRSFAKDSADFEDLKQDTYVNIWNGINSFRGESDIKTWIYRITLNTCVSTYRKISKRQLFSKLDESHILHAPKDKYESIQYINALLSLLPTDAHAIMVMWLDGLEYEEIAKIMGMNRNTVATKIKRAKDRIQQLIESKNF